MRLILLFFYMAFTSSMLAQISYNMKLQANDNPLISGQLGNDIWGYEHNGDEYAVIGSSTKITIYKVSDCTNPTIEHEWTGLNSTIWRDFKDYGNYLYAVDDNGGNGLLIIDKGNYTHYTHNQASSNEFSEAHNIFIDTQHGRLYAVGSDLGFHNLGIYDLNASPTNPPLLKNINLRTLIGDGGSYYIHDMYVKDHIGYANHIYAGIMRIWDFTDVNNISLLGAFDNGLGIYNHSCWLTDNENHLVVASETAGSKIEILNVSDFSNITKDTSFHDPLLAPTHINATPHNPFIKDDLLYISYYHDGVQVYDIQNPEKPFKVAYYDTYPSNTNYSGGSGCWGVYPFLPSGCIVASDRQTGLYTMRVAIRPEHVIRLENTDVLFDGNDQNLILRDLEENTYKIFVDVPNTLVDLVPTPSSNIDSKAKNADLYFDTYGNGPIINQGGSYYRIIIRNTGELDYILLPGLPSNLVKWSSGELQMMNYQSGFILKDNVGQCWKTYVTDNGSLATEIAECKD